MITKLNLKQKLTMFDLNKIYSKKFSTSPCLFLDNQDEGNNPNKSLDKGKGRATEEDLEPKSLKEAWEVAYNSLEGSGLSDDMRREFATQQTNYNPNFSFSDQPLDDSADRDWLNSRTSMAEQKLAEYEYESGKNYSKSQDYDSDDSDIDSDVDRVLTSDLSEDQRALLESYIERDDEGNAVLGETQALKEAAKAAVLDRRANMEDLYHPFAPSVHNPYNTCATQAWRDICEAKEQENFSEKEDKNSKEDQKKDDSKKKSSDSKDNNSGNDNSGGESSNSGNNNPGGNSSGSGTNDPGEGSSGGNDPGVGSSSGFFRKCFDYIVSSEFVLDALRVLINILSGDDSDDFMS